MAAHALTQLTSLREEPRVDGVEALLRDESRRALGLEAAVDPLHLTDAETVKKRKRKEIMNVSRPERQSLCPLSYSRTRSLRRGALCFPDDSGAEGRDPPR